MKKLVYALCVFLTLSAVLLPGHQAKADHFAGTELTFAYTGVPGIYLLRFQFYRDCGGIAAPNGISVRLLANTCAGTPNMTFSLQKTSFREVSEVCFGQATECSTPPNAAVPGVQLHEYSNLIFLPTTPNGCPNWKFEFSGCCRNAGIINLNNGNSINLGFYTDVLLNNQNFIANSSPVFSSSPVPYVCLNDTVNYNPQVSDSDGDSLVYSLVPARGTVPLGGAIVYTPNYTFSQPFGNSTITPYPAVLNPQTGQLTFQPTMLGSFVVVIKVEEWRRINGIATLVGMVHRDVQVQVVQCTSAPPQLNNLTLSTNGIAGAPYHFSVVQELEACQSYCIEIPASTPAPAPVVLNMSSNAQNEIPGSTFVVTDQNTPNPKGMLCFTPGAHLAGQNLPFTIALADNACPYPNDLIRAVLIKIKKSTGYRTTASADSICVGQTVQLSSAALTGVLPLSNPAYQGFSWTAVNLAGAPVNGQFQGSTTGLTAVVNPTQTTRYILTSPTSFGCTDTASVVVHVKGVQPTLQPLTLPHPVLCENRPFTIQPVVTAPPNATGTTWTYSWSPGTGLSSTTVANPVVTYAGQSQVNYQLTVSNGGCSATSTLAVQFAPGISTSSSVAPASLCMGQMVQLSSTVTGPGAPGSTFSWIAGDRILTNNAAATTAMPASLGINQYVVQVTTAQGCVVTDTLSVNVTGVQPQLQAVTSSAAALCTGQQAQLQAVVSPDPAATNPVFTYNWSPAAGLSSLTIPNPVVTASGQSTQTYSVVVTNGTCSESGTVSIDFIPQISVAATAAPLLICLSDTVELAAAVLPGNVQGVIYQWHGSGVSDQGAATTTAVPLSPQTTQYIVEASLGGNCLSRDTVQVQIQGVRAAISSIGANPAVICPGQTSTLSVEASGNAGSPAAGFAYQWSPVTDFVGSSASSSAVVQPPATSFYHISITDNGQCEVRDSVEVQVAGAVSPVMGISYSPDSLAVPPITVSFQDLTPSTVPADSVSWFIQPVTGSAAPVHLQGSNPTHTLSEQGTYQVTLTVYVQGCPYSATRQVVVSGIKVPNIITPNGDGVNDVFEVPGLATGAEVTVYSRWGKKIDSFGKGGSWAPQNATAAGVYYYLISTPGEETRKGWLEVVR